MAASKQPRNETKTAELSDVELSKVSGGIIAVLRQNAKMGDGSVVPSPMITQSQNALIGLL